MRRAFACVGRAGANHSRPSALQRQIYRTINRLADQGLVTGKEAPSPIGPDKRVYRTTAKGKAELKRWLKDGPVSPVQRTAVFAQLIFLARVPDLDAAQFLVAMKTQADGLVAALEQAPDDDGPQTDEGRRVAFFNRASLGLGLARAKATQAFVNALIDQHEAEFGSEGRRGNVA